MSLIANSLAGPDMTIRDAMARLDHNAGKLLLMVNQQGVLVRVVSDGDLRRLLLAGHQMDDTLAALPPRAPLTAPVGTPRAELAALFRSEQVNHLPLVDAAGCPVELISARDTGRILLSTPHLGEEEESFVKAAFDSNWIAPVGPNLDGFEADLADYLGIPHVAALSSGTAAIHLALAVLDVGPGDRVFCSTLTFAATVNPILYQGATPVFIDSAPGSWNMCPETLARALAEAAAENALPRAVIAVSLYGQPADIDAIKAACDVHGVPLIEDAAEVLGARYKDRAAGISGLLGIYSFNGNKIITTSAGGALVSHDKRLIDRAKFLSTQAKDPAPHYQHSVIGYNYRMSNILAGVGRGQMTVLDTRVAQRRQIFDTYRTALENHASVQFLPELPGTTSTQWLSCMLLSPDAALTPTDVIAGLDAQNIEARPVWKPMHRQPVFERYPYHRHAGNLSVSDDLFARGLCLPSGSNMTDRDVAHIVEVLRSIL